MVGSNGHLAANMVRVIDCLEGMKRLPHEYVDLVFADPPYNIGVDYGKRKMTEIPDCPEFMEFMKWYEEQVGPGFNKFYTHVATCPQCQKVFLEFRGQFELKMLQTSDDELFKAMKEL